MPDSAPATDGDLALFACPNSDCTLFNQFDAGNLSVCERVGKGQHVRRLYCNHCGQRFTENRGSLMQYTKLPKPTVVRIVKCLGHGCSIEATADICEVDPRTVQRLLKNAGRRAADFHPLQLERLERPPEAVELDELHGRVCKPPADVAAKRGRPRDPMRSRMGGGLVDAVAAWVGGGFTWLWR
jgi:transposase-like protein